MNSKLHLISKLALSAVASMALAGAARAQVTVASDLGSDPAYTAGNSFIGLNGGTGFQPWTDGAAYTKVGPPSGASSPETFALWSGANSSASEATAVRPFDAPLSVGETFSISQIYEYNTNAVSGFSLQDSLGDNLITIGAAVSYPTYTNGTPVTVTDASNPSGFNTGLYMDYGGGSRAFTNYAITIDSVTGGVTDYTLNITGGDRTLPPAYNGSFDGTVSQVQLFQSNSVATAGFETNNLQITSSVPEPATYAAVLSGLGMLLGLQKFRSRKA